MQLKPTPHPTQSKTPEQISYRLIKEYKRENFTDRKENFIVWWIIAWGNGPAVLEKRRIYICAKNGILKTYKQMPWNLNDMKWLAENFTDIVETLQS